MNKAKVEKLILGARGELSSLGGTYFFRKDFSHVISGFAIEYIPGGAYLWQFAFPLFDVAAVSLTFSRRIGGESGYVVTHGKSPEDFASEVLSNKEVIDGVAGSMNLKEFMASIEREPDSLRNPVVRMVYASALFLCGAADEGKRELEAAGPGLSGKRREHFESLSNAVGKSLEAALLILTDLERRKVQELGIA